MDFESTEHGGSELSRYAMDEVTLPIAGLEFFLEKEDEDDIAQKKISRETL